MPLLAAMLPDLSPQDALERIRALPFVQADKDGLRIHDAVREAIALALRAENPQRYREYRRAAYLHCMSELRAAAASNLWRCTADLLYLLENPVVREAFFPTGAQEYVVEPAQLQDGQQILDIIDRHENSALAGSLGRWWTRAPETFMVTRDDKGIVAGFYCAFDPSLFPARFHHDDPVNSRVDRASSSTTVTTTAAHSVSAAVAGRRNRRSTLGRPSGLLVRSQTQVPGTSPHLRRVYLTVQDLGPYAAVAQTLGFNVLPGTRTQKEPGYYSTAMLDFGPSSVDGWLARLVAAELGVEEMGSWTVRHVNSC